MWFDGVAWALHRSPRSRKLKATSLAFDAEEIAAGASYVIHTEAPVGDHDRWPGWLQEACPEAAGKALRIPAPDTAGLREVLQHCHGSGMPVRSVETQRTGLEDLFLSVQESRGGA